ncbi:MAG: hypothetical protein AB7H97_05625, partial [Pseudobdellovibrionaceae bacterium]
GLGFCYLIFVSFRRRVSKFSSADAALALWGLPFILVFGYSSLKGETRIYWPGFAIFPFSILFLKSLKQQEQAAFRAFSSASGIVLVIVLAATLYLPIGSLARPVIELFRDYDLRMSPRGDVKGWDSWSKRTIGEHAFEKNRTLFLASNFRLASQLLWNSDLSPDQVTAIDRPHQYAIWRAPDPRDFSKIILFGDNRYPLELEDIRRSCLDERPQVRQTDVKMISNTVKVIHHVECEKINLESLDKMFSTGS